MKTITKLLNLDGKVYVYLSSDNVARIFLQNAEAEGFRFGDGKKPTKRRKGDIYALNRDFTIDFVGYVGHMAFHYPNSNIIRVDYAAYLRGSKNYILKK